MAGPTDNDGFSRFTFSLHAADDTVKDLELRTEALKHRIDHIVENVVIAAPPDGMTPNMPILDYILRLKPTRRETEVLAQALLRIAPLREEYEQLAQQMTMVKMVRENPRAVAALFGDFSEVDLSPDMFDQG